MKSHHTMFITEFVCFCFMYFSENNVLYAVLSGVKFHCICVCVCVFSCVCHNFFHLQNFIALNTSGIFTQMYITIHSLFSV
jgi:hypothetical protein